MRCSVCKSEDNLNKSWWDRIRLFFFHLFSEDIQDLSEDKYTKGVGEGFKIGWEQATNKKPITYEDIIKVIKEED